MQSACWWRHVTGLIRNSMQAQFFNAAWLVADQRRPSTLACKFEAGWFKANLEES